MHTGADPSDVQHVSDEVEDAMERPRFCARGPCPTSRRNAHQISALVFSKNTELWLRPAPAYHAMQSYASTVEARDFCKQRCLQVSSVLLRGISATALQET